MEQFFLVAQLQEPLKLLAEEIREKINNRFKIYGDIEPVLHTTIEVLRTKEKEDLILAKKIIKDVVADFSPFCIEVTGFEFFPAPHKAITLGIKKNREIGEISFLLHNQLQRQGLTDREDFAEWKFHITVAGTFGAQREWNNEEFTEACHLVENMDVSSSCLVDTLELWRPVLFPQKKEIAVFKLAK